MAVAALPDHLMLRNPNPLDFRHRVTGETVASALGHFFGIGGVAPDARLHHHVTRIDVDRFKQ